MKKIMVMLAAAVITAVSHAASFDWSVATGSTYAGMNVYCISGKTFADVVAAFSATDDASKWSAVVKGITPSVASGGARGVALGGLDGVKDGDSLVFAIIKDDIAEGNTWYAFNYSIPTGTTYEPPTTGVAQKVTVTSPSSGTFTLKSSDPTQPPDVPEPTSGLLLVLGGAALALRRKQK